MSELSDGLKAMANGLDDEFKAMLNRQRLVEISEGIGRRTGEWELKSMNWDGSKYVIEIVPTDRNWRRGLK